MARNRKRRGAPRPSDAEATPPGAVAARTGERNPSRIDDTSDPLGHAAPNAEIAEAELAEGEQRASRLAPLGGAVPGVTGPTPQIPQPTPADEGEDPGEVYDEELGDGGNGGDIVGGDSGGRRGGGGDGGDSEGMHPAPRPARHRFRIVAFIQGSWRELQRVQWPDQRQVVQATGVVIGFVIVAGAWLGLADWVATKIVNFIL